MVSIVLKTDGVLAQTNFDLFSVHAKFLKYFKFVCTLYTRTSVRLCVCPGRAVLLWGCFYFIVFCNVCSVKANTFFVIQRLQVKNLTLVLLAGVDAIPRC